MALPSVGTKAVHKDNQPKGEGPVWEVVDVNPTAEKPIGMNHARHKLNEGREPGSRQLTEGEFNSDYVQL